MAYSSTSSNSDVSTDSNCSSSCLENVKILKEQNEQLLKDLRTSNLNVIAYKTGLESVEARLLVYKKNESIYEEDIKVLKRENHLREVAITELRRKKLYASKTDMSFSGLEEFTSEPIVIKPIVEKSEAKASEAKPKEVRKNNGALIIEDWVSDSEEENVSQTKIEKKTAKPSFFKIDFVKTKQTNKTNRKTAKQVYCNYQRVIKPVWNNAKRVNHQNFAKKTHPFPKKNMVPRAVLMKYVLVSLNTVRQVNTAHPKIRMNSVRPMTNARPKVVVNVVKGNNVNVVKALAYWGNPLMDLQDKGVIDRGCSRHMTGNMSYITDYEEIDGGYVTFEGNPKGGKITGKGTIKTGNLDFENVYFVRELKFNLFSVSQICDKKNSVLFNDTECIVLSPNFELTDESQVLLKVPRKNDMYSVDLKNIVPKGGLTCLFSKATSDESELGIGGLDT
ncbi:hypothetical protein Tco_0799340 [Tanacetum coccineum]|uniref:Retrovirus-related Pol polyprotein from transposon TNT 1-94-like beta-barrel domain-containing protein n=1 Tax=Tanacetum coccineum TaxID=301880 RepID=A0ABQ4ZR23_9ASTR